MRTFRAGEADGVCSGAGGAVTDCSGKIEEAGDSSGIAEGVGVGDSCAKTVEAKNAIRIAVLIFVVMSRAIETSLIR